MNDKELDQFYTNDQVVENIINKDIPEGRYFVDPCIGTGAFLPIYEGQLSLLMDIDPKINGVITQDFLTASMSDYNLPTKDQVIVITNPPFGFGASLAVKFFNKCTEFANEIRFIIPRTFRKQSVHNKLNLNYHLVSDVTLPKNSFIFKGEAYDVPCCYQTWVYKPIKRKKIVKLTSKYFIFTTKDKANIAIRRAGGKAGKVLEGLEHSKSSTYFIALPQKYLKKIQQLEPSKDVNNTAGVKSISKSELITNIEKLLMTNKE